MVPRTAPPKVIKIEILGMRKAKKQTITTTSVRNRKNTT